MSKYFYVGILGDYMAGNTVNIKMVLTAEGVAAQQKASKEIADNYERANRATGKAQGPAPMSSASRSAPHTGSAVTEREYGVVRGAVGTGAAGRDFAKQAQGLGGLVALYATFAANIFAVGAAYEALNKAAATERLAKATEMLSISTGIHLKSVSKNLVEASGYALSFSEAMQFTNIGTSAGLASAQIQSLTKIAKGAASALGRDVGDSVRRIIQGTAKQEQEILDELGIFVKASQAYEKFAAVNKIKVADMTGAQRTQAYANEVERLGKKWNEFAEIPDPFSKFAATGKNALNDLLVGVNKLATPFLNFLSESKEGIQALIVLITVSLAKRAIPELGGLFNSLFNYDKDKASASNALMLREVEGNISRVKAAVIKGQQELKALGALTPINADSTKAAFSSLAAVKGGAAGISTASLSTKMSKLTDGYTDLSKLKSAADIEHQITQSLKTQYGYKKDSAGYIQKLVDSNVLVNGSTKENLILSKQAKDIASAHFIEMQKRVNAQGTINTLLKEDAANTAILDKALAEADRLKNSSNKSRAIIEAPTMSTIGDSRTISEAEGTRVLAAAKEKASIAQISMNKAVAAGLPVQTEDVISIQAQVLATNQLAAAKAKATVAEIALVGATNKGNLNGLMTDSLKGIEASFNQGGWTGFKNGILDTGKAMGTMFTATQAAGKEIPTLTNSAGMGAKAMSLWTSTTTAASGATKILGLALKGVLGALSAALGPLMIAWTVWELFGDTIKKWIGIDTEAAARLEEAKKAHTEYAETVGLAALSLKAVNEARVAGISSIEEKIRNDTVELNAYKGHVDAYIKMAAEKKAAAEKASLADMHKNDRPGQVFSEQAFSLTQIASTEGADASKVAQLQALAKETQALANARSLILQDGPALVANTKAQADVEARVVEIMKAGIIPMEQRSAMDSKLESSAKAFTKALDEQEKVQKKLGDPTLGLNSERAKTAYDSFKNIVESTSPALIRAKALQLDLARMVAMGGKFAAIAAPMYDELAIAQASANTRIAHGLLSPKEAEAELAAFIAKLQGKALSIGKLFNEKDKAPKAITPYSQESKNEFAALKNDIDAASIAMKTLTATSNVSKAFEDTLASINGVASASSIAAEEMRAKDMATLELTKAKKDAELDFQKVIQNRTLKGRDKTDAVTEAAKAKENKAKEAKLTKEAADAQALINSSNSTAARITADINIQLTRANELETNRIGLAQQLLTGEANALALKEAQGYATEKELAQAQLALDIKNQQFATESAISALGRDTSSKSTTLVAQVQNNQGEEPGQVALRDAAIAQLIIISDEYNRQRGLIEGNSAASLAHAQSLGAIKIAQAGNNDEMAKMVEITNSLTGAFGDLGTNIGKAGEALLKMAQDDEKYTKDRQGYQDKIDDPKTEAKGRQEAFSALEKLEKKAAKDKLGNIATTASATKKMFAEHTGAYKVLNAVEKGAHAFKMAMQIKEMAIDAAAFLKKIFFVQAEVPVVAGATAAKTGIELAGQAATMPAKIAGAYASFMSMLGPFGPPAAAIAIAALIGSFAGGGKSVPRDSSVGKTSEDMQKSQGTGQSWVDDGKETKLVDNGRGVFGDSSAKSESIANSIEIMKNNSIEGLDFDNKMLKAMEKVAAAVTGAAKSIYSVPGLRQGTNFGTLEGSSKEAGFGGDIPIIGGILSGIFGGGSSTTTSIVAAGVRLSATFDNLASGSEGIVDQFKNVRTITEEDGGWFGSDSRSDSTTPEYASLTASAERAIRDIFKQSKELFIEVGSTIGVTADVVKTTLEGINLNIPIDLKGLSGQDLLDELNGVIGSILDDAAKQLFSSMDKFKEFGEGYLQTTIRVVDGNNKLDQALRSMGSTFDVTKDIVNEVAYGFQDYEGIFGGIFGGLGEALSLVYTQYETISKFDISEALIKGAGGLENFMDQASFFTDTFLTEAEQLAPVQKAVTDRLNELGLSSITTNDQFKNLVTSQDLSTEAGRLLYQNLMDLAPGFNTVAKAAEELTKSQRDQATELLSLQGMTRVVTERNREDKLAELALVDVSLVTGQQAIYAQEDLNTTRGLELALLSAQGNSLEVLSISRQKELNTLSESDRVIQRKIYAAQDEAKTYDLTTELMTAQGLSSEVLNRNRLKELKSLSSSDAALKVRIWQLQDEAKLLEQKNSQESTIYTLLGNSAAALQLTREKELSTMDEQLKPAQLYIYALQDEATLKGKLKTAYDKEKTAIKSTIDSIGGLIKSLKDAKDAMLTGDKSPLTPAERYAEAKRQAYSVAALATSIATTDSEIAARNDAVSKLPSVTSTFLDASRDLYASSEQYTQDFNSVLKILDDTSILLGDQKTDAQQQLEQLTSIDSRIQELLEPTISSASYLEQLNNLLPQVLAAREASATSGSVASGGSNITPTATPVSGGSATTSPASYFDKYQDIATALTPLISANGISEDQLSAIHYAYWGYKEGRDNPNIPLDSAAASLAFKIPREDILAQANLAGVEAFAKGGLASGMAMVGEQGPELIDFKTPTRVYSNTASNQLLSNKELIEEIRRLRTEVSQLRAEQKEQTGHLIQASYDSNAQNAKTIADATEQAAVNTTWSQRSQLKLA